VTDKVPLAITPRTRTHQGRQQKEVQLS